MQRVEEKFKVMGPKTKEIEFANSINLEEAAHSEPAQLNMPWPRGCKTFFMLNSIEHEFFLLINVKMPTIVGILTCMSGENSILGLSEPKQS